MTTRTVTTQTGLDTALAESREHPDDWYDIRIESPRGVWLVISEASGSATVEAYDSATVEASGSATVEAYDSATVRASGSATVRAYDSATVEAYDSATVEAYGSATVRASDSATVEAYDSATVRASGSATVEAYDSATVRAYDSATVRAYGSATVEAYDSATVRASGSATVRAGSHTAVHLHSGRCTVNGGVLIDHTTVDLTSVETWAGYHGADITDGQLTAYKAVRDDWRSQRGTSYEPGTTASCDDFTDVDECGGGLHFSPTPRLARCYDNDATRYVELRVPAASVRTITSGGAAKAKAASVECVREVDIDGKPIAGAVGSTS